MKATVYLHKGDCSTPPSTTVEADSVFALERAARAWAEGQIGWPYETLLIDPETGPSWEINLD